MCYVYDVGVSVWLVEETVHPVLLRASPSVPSLMKPLDMTTFTFLELSRRSSSDFFPAHARHDHVEDNQVYRPMVGLVDLHGFG